MFNNCADPRLYTEPTNETASFVTVLQEVKEALEAIGFPYEAEAIDRVLENCLEQSQLGGLGLSPTDPLTVESLSKILFRVGAWLEALNSAEQARRLPSPLAVKPSVRRPMNLAEKIFAHHSLGGIAPEGLQTGDFVQVMVDWSILSELSWVVSQQAEVLLKLLGSRAYLYIGMLENFEPA